MRSEHGYNSKKEMKSAIPPRPWLQQHERGNKRGILSDYGYNGVRLGKRAHLSQPSLRHRTESSLAKVAVVQPQCYRNLRVNLNLYLVLITSQMIVQKDKHTS